MQSTKELLERDGFHDLKVTEVATNAEVSSGVFYIYFKDKNDLILSLFDMIIEDNISHIFDGDHISDAFEAVLAANRRYVELFVSGEGLNRAIGQIVDALPAARERWQAANAKIAERIAKGMARQSGEEAPTDWQLFAALALQAMLDSILLQTFAYRDPALTEMARNPEKLAHYLSVLWFRAAYGRDPDLSSSGDPIA